VRGAKRRLRALDRWADSFEGYFPVEDADEKYWHWKLPVLDRLVKPPTTTKEIQSHCAKAILRAVIHLSNAKPPQFKSAIVTALITYPEMFGSELCIFFDSDYFESFYDRDNDWQSVKPMKSGSLAKHLGFEVPDTFIEVGYIHQAKDDWEGETKVFKEEWWSYREQKGS